MSEYAFRIFITVLIVAGASWALFDIVKMRKLRGKNLREPLVRDELFGYIMGIVIGAFALSGVLRFNGVI